MLRSQFRGHSGFELNEDCKTIEHLRYHLRTHHPREYAQLGLTSKAATPSGPTSGQGAAECGQSMFPSGEI